MPLTPEQMRAIEALLTCKTRDIAARKAKISRATLFRWLQEPEFARAHYDSCNRMHEYTIASIQSSHTEANETLRVSLKSEDEVIRVRAAAVLMDAGFRAAEHFALVKEIRELKAQLDEYRKSTQGNSRTAGATGISNDAADDRAVGGETGVLPLTAG